MTSKSAWHRVVKGAKLGLGAVVVAGVVAFSGSGHAATFTGNLGDPSAEQPGALQAYDGDPTILLPGAYTFGSSYVGGDAGRTLTFNFQNPSDSLMVLTLLNITILQSAGTSDADAQFFTGGVDTFWGLNGLTQIGDTAEKESALFQNIKTTLAPLEMISLVFTFGDVVAPVGGGTDIDFNIAASVVPLPAGLVLFLSGLAGIGFLGRYKAKRREPAVA